MLVAAALLNLQEILLSMTAYLYKLLLLCPSMYVLRLNDPCKETFNSSPFINKLQFHISNVKNI